MTIWVVGQITVDLIYRGPDTADSLEPHRGSTQPRIGGKAFNIAAALAKLGAKVRLVSAVGDDQYARLALSNMKLAGIGTELVISGSGGRTRPLATPVTKLTEGIYGERAVLIDLDQNIYQYYNIALTRALNSINNNERLPQAIVYTLEFRGGLLAVLAKLVRQAQQSHKTLVIGNPAPRGTDTPTPDVGELLRLSDSVIPNRYEARYLAMDDHSIGNDTVALAHRIREMYGLSDCICTLGEDGWVWSSASAGDGKGQVSRAIVREKVGASDVFTGTFTLLTLAGAPIDVATFGAGLAAREAIQKDGSHERFPTRSELLAVAREEGNPLSAHLVDILERSA